MAEIGKLNTLRVVKEVDFGLYLDGGEHGEILLPKRYVPENAKPEDILEVFIYLDSEDRIIATTETPHIMLGEFACLKAVAVSSMGAFLDWGLMKDLFVPFREQKLKMEEGRWYIVTVYLDSETKRLVASAKIEKFLDNIPPDYEAGQEVDLLIVGETDLGFNAIINNQHLGVIYKNEIFQPLRKGERIKGYIKKIREDEKIDLLLQKPGYAKVDDISMKIVNVLKSHDGYLPVTDKSDPDTIYELFGVSKKTYKKAIGALFKFRLIDIEDKGIRLK
ncbi:MAG: GntR family transcriptional regulator [Bacteroidales bacterium]|nr:MAG: GntR family transcriptional regulator [Bacteroidales bacterium]